MVMKSRRQNNKIQLDNQKMLEIASYLKGEMPGCGFALIGFELDNGNSIGKYISNVKDEFIVKALESQLQTLKRTT